MGANTGDPVTFHLRGGLGNQLFQYAAGRAVAARLGVPLQFDIRECGWLRERPLLLDKFNVIGTFKTEGDFPPLSQIGLVAQMRHSIFAMRKRLIIQNEAAFDQRILRAKPGTYFKGFWQSEEYFAPIAKTLRVELTFRDPLHSLSQKLLEKIRLGTSVAVHVRRGDYVHDPNAARIFAACSIEYYERAAAEIAAQCNRDLTFFIFSDELGWAAKHLKLPGHAHVVDIHSHSNAHEDLRLIAACDHQIIANSTFSWWGAWLNGNAQKIVIAPETWYLTAKLSNKLINSSNFVVLPNLGRSGMGN